MTIQKLDKNEWESYFEDAARAARIGEQDIRITSGSITILASARLRSTAFDAQNEALAIDYQGGQFIIHSVSEIALHGWKGGTHRVTVSDTRGQEFLLDVSDLERSSRSGQFDVVAEAGEDSFPASDPPAWSGSSVL